MNAETPTTDDFKSLRLRALNLELQARELVKLIEANCPLVLYKMGSDRVRNIKVIVASFFNLDVGVMASKQRPEKIAWPRQIAMFFAREFTDLKLESIGAEFGGKDHGTVLHAVRRVTERCDVCPPDKIVVDHLRLQIESALNKKEKEAA